MGELFLELISEIIIIVAVGLAGVALNWYKSNIKNDKVREIIADGVKFSQQVYSHLDGEERFAFAKNEIVDMLNEKGFDISTNRIDTLIESVLKELKSEYGENWYK